MTTAQRTSAASVLSQGELWSRRALDFATQEPKVMPLYEDALDQLQVEVGLRLLDVGCGPGLFLKLAEQRGAIVSGLDAAAAFIEIARKRTPEANLVVGDMEQLPFDDRSFDVVTSFNAFEFAAAPVRALAEAARVATTDAPILIAAWGRPDQCEAAAYVTELAALLPPPPTDAVGPFAFSQPGTVETLAGQAGLRAGPRRDILCVWEYADRATLLRALRSPGFAVRAIEVVGEEAVTRAILRSVAPFRLSDGSYRLENIFSYVIALKDTETRTAGIDQANTHG